MGRRRPSSGAAAARPRQRREEGLAARRSSAIGSALLRHAVSLFSFSFFDLTYFAWAEFSFTRENRRDAQQS